MKKLIKFFGIVLIASGILFACSDEFLDGPAQGVLDEGTLGNADGVEATLIAAYAMLDGYAEFGGWGGAGSNWIFGSVASDDSYKGSEPGDQQPATDVEFYQWGTGGSDGYVNDKWSNLYEGISRTNATLNLLAKVGDGVTADNQRRIEGESKFLRAHYHFEAYKFWKNIPYYTELDDDFAKPNNADPLPSIISDLEAAASTLPASQGQIGRVTSWTAKAYLGRVRMYEKNYAAAATILRDVVDNGPYALQNCFHDVFDVDFDNGVETILAFQASSNDGDPNGNNGNRNDRLNFPHGGSPFGCCGFHQPSQNLVNAFKVDANGLPFLDGSGKLNNVNITANDFVDPRLDWTVGRDDVPFLDWGLHAPGWIRDRAWAGPYSPKKSIYEKATGVGSTVGWASYQLHSLNLHILRFADVMLMLAEAEVENNNLEAARTLVNRVRARAGVCAQGPDGVSITTTIDDPAITWAKYKVSQYPNAWTDQNAARNAVRIERRVELAMEGHRFFDLRRWGTFKEVLNEFVNIEKTRRNYLTGASVVEDRHSLYPLPTVQIELSTIDGEKRLVQNPGW